MIEGTDWLKHLEKNSLLALALSKTLCKDNG